MSSADRNAKSTEWKEALDACTDSWSAAHHRFTEVLHQREVLHGLIKAADKAGDSSALVALYAQDNLLDVAYEAAARALIDAHRNQKAVLQAPDS